MNEAIPSAWFAAYAGSDIGRWRELCGETVEPSDPKWGTGRVRDVRWEARRGEIRPLGTIYAIVEYDGGLAAQVNVGAFADLHVSVSIPKRLAVLVREGFDPQSSLAEAEREERLEKHDRERIARRDAERTQRAKAVRNRAAADDAGR